MTTVLRLLVAALTVGGAGFGLTMLLVRRRPVFWENCALSWLLGTAVVSVALWIAGFLLHGTALLMAVTAGCMLLFILGYQRWRRIRGIQRTGAKSWTEIVFIGLFAFEYFWIYLLTIKQTLGWDGILVWEIKARYAFWNGGVLPAAYFRDPSRWFSNPDYPPLLPLVETWFYSWIGDCNQFWIKFIFPFWYLAAASMLLMAVEELSGKRWIGWMIVLLFPFVPCLHNAAGGFQTGYADAPLSAIFLATTFYFLRFVRQNSTDDLRLFIALGATLPWIKPEGVMLWAAISLCGVIAIGKRRNIRTATLSLLPGGFVIVLWHVFLHAVHALFPQDFLPVTPSVLRHNIGRTGVILHALWQQFIDWHDWDIFWVLVGIAVIAVVIRQRNSRGATLVWLMAAAITCYCVSYLFSNWTNYGVHIEVSLTRRLIQITPIGWLLIALALRPWDRPRTVPSIKTTNASPPA